MKPYLMYLRKSRKDRDQELQTGNFDTLQRHRDALLALAERLGCTVAHIYEEVVSGDSIADRPEMQKLLAAVETGAFEGVLVMEVPRLARGNTRDQGVVAETFQYSGTKIVTPEKTYDPADEADEEYFEFGLFMSRREYKAINRRLQRGRMASLSEGKYIAGAPPYGYRKVKLPHQKGFTLEPVPETAGVVREIFQLYTLGEPQPDGGRRLLGSLAIANLLNARGVPSPGGVRWSASAVRDVLKNPAYAGYIRWAHRPDARRMEDGRVVIRHPVNKDAPLQKGLHPPLVTEETWTAARSMMAGRSHAPVPGRGELSNPLAGLVYCSVCGRSLAQVSQGGRGAPMLLCPTAGCPTVGSRRDVVERALLAALSEWLEACRLRLPAEGRESALAIREAEQSASRAAKRLEALRRRKDGLCDLLEGGVYTRDVFLERTQVLTARIAEARREAETLRRHLEGLRRMEAAEKSAASRVRSVPEAYAALETPAGRNALLKAVLDHVVYFKSQGGAWRESDLRLYIYPKLQPLPPDGLYV